METEFKPNYAIHPGIVLKEDLKLLKISQIKLSKLTGISKTVINEIIKGKRDINAKIAVILEEFIGFEPAGFWIKLQSFYDETKARLELYEEKNSVVIEQNFIEEDEIHYKEIQNKIIVDFEKDILFAA